jgi:hypothetical protein
MSGNPAILSDIHHLQNPLESNKLSTSHKEQYIYYKNQLVAVVWRNNRYVAKIQRFCVKAGGKPSGSMKVRVL